MRTNTPVSERHCKRCGILFMPRGRQAKVQFHCTRLCTQKAQLDRAGMKSQFADIPRNTVGAINELRACVDLMAKGFDVFRAQSPSSAFDLVIASGRKVYGVCVKTGYRHMLNGKLYHPKELHEYDIFAVVTRDEIVYMDSNRQVIDLKSLK